MGLISSERCVSTGGSIPCLSASPTLAQVLIAPKEGDSTWQYLKQQGLQSTHAPTGAANAR